MFSRHKPLVWASLIRFFLPILILLQNLSFPFIYQSERGLVTEKGLGTYGETVIFDLVRSFHVKNLDCGRSDMMDILP